VQPRLSIAGDLDREPLTNQQLIQQTCQPGIVFHQQQSGRNRHRAVFG
jgi:hypothetical protein